MDPAATLVTINLWLAIIPSGSCCHIACTECHCRLVAIGTKSCWKLSRMLGSKACDLSTAASSIFIILDVYSFCPESPCSSASLACTSLSPVCFVPFFNWFLLFLFLLLLLPLSLFCLFLFFISFNSAASFSLRFFTSIILWYSSEVKTRAPVIHQCFCWWYFLGVERMSKRFDGINPADTKESVMRGDGGWSAFRNTL